MPNFPDEIEMQLTRRRFLEGGAGGIGIAALASLAGSSACASDAPAARAKRVISIFQSGGPAQMELFDYKPGLRKLHGQNLPASVLGKQRLTGFVAAQKSLPVIASPFSFSRHGDCGAWVSELLPHLSTRVDDICFIKSMNTEAINHDPAVTFRLTGSQIPGRPSIGSWLSYGLGSENRDLPAFVVLLNTSKLPGATTPLSSRHWGSGFLPSVHQGVQFRSAKDPVLFLGDPPGIDRATRRRMLDAGAALNRVRSGIVGDPEIEARISQYELAYRMQSSVPGLMDLSTEPRSVFELYGELSRTPGSYASNCVVARRLIESGVRFVQIFDRDWDHHFNAPANLRLKARETDQATAALLVDLKQRGLLDDTLIVCGGEFGRSVYSQGPLQKVYGRDHHGRCFTSWMAGAGVRGGVTIGKTDEYSFNVIEDPVHVHDLNATILHLLGIDHTELTFRFQGRDHRLTDVEGIVVKKAIS
jgi:hypothetical protein